MGSCSRWAICKTNLLGGVCLRGAYLEVGSYLRIYGVALLADEVYPGINF